MEMFMAQIQSEGHFKATPEGLKGHYMGTVG